ncbi:metallophosphoesterase [Ornithinibacillus sp. BX22]|uniref:Phosphoesterase n=2 Tax=Ornithinibacillus TaxID=484508 RepID=A0A923L6Q8_9BACI|nr:MULTISPECIES: metallophosphoesterase [Ornithinibacillus]MBC5637548.1 metallophosphoesterase [Ornithinibacillus hominis]MBS3679416.1 metallophosphoesterase [Ornithinibacillus massiliensis]
MPKVVIMSDSHGLTKEIAMIRERENAPYIFHCGDSELNERAKELEGVFTVSGNCDLYGEFPNEIIKEINGLTFLVVHGHLHNVKMNLLNLSYRADEVNADIICFGHSHIAGLEKVSGKLFLNPGSIRLPRMRTEKTYCVLEWEERDRIAVMYRTVEGKIVEELSYTTALD